jgi:hypothetical protein
MIHLRLIGLSVLAASCLARPTVPEVKIEAIKFDEPHETSRIEEPDASFSGLLAGHHVSFDTPAPMRCAEPSCGTARRRVTEVGSEFVFKYNKDRKSLRNDFQLGLRGEVDLRLVHGRASLQMREVASSTDQSIYLTLKSRRWYKVGFDIDDVRMTGAALKRLEKKAPADQVALEHIEVCGAGWRKSEVVGGELDVVLELGMKDYESLKRVQKEVEAKSILVDKKWFDNQEIQAAFKNAKISAHVFAAGFKYKGAEATSESIKKLIDAKLVQVQAANGNGFREVVDLIKEIYDDLKKSVEEEEQLDRQNQPGARLRRVLQVVIGDYFNLENAPIEDPDSQLADIKRAIDKLLRDMEDFYLDFHVAESRADRGYREALRFYYARSGLQQPAYGFVSDWRNTPLLYTNDIDTFLVPYVGWRVAGPAPIDWKRHREGGEFDIGNRDGVRARSWARVKRCREMLPRLGAQLLKDEGASMVWACGRPAETVLEYRVLTENPINLAQDKDTAPYATKKYEWSGGGDDKSITGPHILRNLYIYEKLDRVLPVAVLKVDGPLSGTDLRAGARSCGPEGRPPQSDEVTKLTFATIEMPFKRAPEWPKNIYQYWLDPVTSGCKPNELPIAIHENQHTYFTDKELIQNVYMNGANIQAPWSLVSGRIAPLKHTGVQVSSGCRAIPDSTKATFVCIAKEGPFGLANEF